jgi:hypothetical protein
MAPQTYPVAVIAKLLDLTPRRIRQLVDEGVIQRAEKGRYELVPSVRGYIRYLRDRAIGADALPDESARASRARLIKAQAEAQEMENAQTRRELVHVDDAAAVAGRIVEAIRPKLLGLGSRISPQVTGCSKIAENKAFIDGIAYELLRDIASIDPRWSGGVVGGGTESSAGSPPAPDLDRKPVGGPVPKVVPGKQRGARTMVHDPG